MSMGFRNLTVLSRYNCMFRANSSRLVHRCFVMSRSALLRCSSGKTDDIDSDSKLFAAFLKQASGPVTITPCMTEQELREASHHCSSLTLLKLMPELLHNATRHMDRPMDFTSERCIWTAPSSTGLLHALLLPKDIPWPAFSGSKFQYAPVPNLLLHRTVQHSVGTDAAIMERLCDGHIVAGLGAEDIGKTVAMDYLLFRCMQSWRQLSGVQQQTDEDSSLGEPNFPFNRILYRCGRHSAFRIERRPCTSSFSSDASCFQLGNDLITVTQFAAQTLDDLDQYCYQFKYDHSTMVLLEMEESERDPIIRLPYFVTTSSNDAENSKLKTFFKTRSTALLYDPWSFTEVYLMALAMDVVSQSIDEAGAEVVRTMRDRVTKRFPLCGGILRAVLKCSNIDIDRIIPSNENISVYNIPYSWKGIIAPFVLPGVSAPFVKDSFNKHSTAAVAFEDEYGETQATSILYEMRFLSPLTAIRLASYKAKLEKIRTLQNLNIDHQIYQAVVLYGGLLRSSYFDLIPESMRRDNWEWHKVGLLGKLAPDEIPDLPWANHVIKFNNKVLPLSASTLDQQGVYASAAGNGYVFDFMHIRGKHIYLYRVLAKSPKERPISLYALHRVLNALFPDRNMEKDNKMTFVMIIPHHLSCSTMNLEYNGYGSTRQSCLSEHRMRGEIKADMLEETKEMIRENYETLLRADALFENRFYIVRAVLQQRLELRAIA